MEGFLGAVALALLHLDGLSGRLHLDPVEVQVEAGHFTQPVRRLHELRITLQLRVARDLQQQYNSGPSTSLNLTKNVVCSPLWLPPVRRIYVASMPSRARAGVENCNSCSAVSTLYKSIKIKLTN